MKKVVAILILIAVLGAVNSCSQNLTEKDDIISLFKNNEEAFLQMIETEDYSEVESLRGVQKVYVSEKYISIECGGSGFGSGTQYYGLFYSAEDDICAVDVAGPKDELVEEGKGYLYQQKDGDNRYYVEPLGNHFFYYEAHF